jgi:hypothetical protein
MTAARDLLLISSFPGRGNAALHRRCAAPIRAVFFIRSSVMHVHATTNLEHFAPDAFRFYRRVCETLQASDIPFLVGGAYAFSYYTGIIRHTKDLDLFVRPGDAQAVLGVLARAGHRTEMCFSHWLGKVFEGTDFVDIIFSSGNGLCRVDDGWFQHAIEAEVLGARQRLAPAEEMIWQKAYIMERERFDGADVNHLLRARGRHLDWDRLLARFGPHWRLLLAHLVLFGFVYPDDHDNVPVHVIRTLTARLHDDPAPALTNSLCQGPLLSRTQYLIDTDEWGYMDPRLVPLGAMSHDQVARWTDAGL